MAAGSDPCFSGSEPNVPRGRGGDEPLDLDSTPAREAVGFLLKRAASRLHQAMEERLKPLGVDSMRHFGVLACTDFFGPVTQHQIGVTIHIDRSTMVGVIDGLEERGLVQRKPDESDRRAYRIHLTEAGRDLLRQVEVVMRDCEAEMLSDLNPDERETLKSLLQRVALDGPRDFSGFEPIHVGRRRRNTSSP